MGCASSSPMMNGSGGIVGAAKDAASDVVHAGEEVLHDVGESINGTVGHVKEAVVGAVQGIGHGLDGAMHGASDEVKKVEAAITHLGPTTALSPPTSDMNDTNSTTEFTYIPLKDPNAANVDDHLEEFKTTLLKKAQSFSDDTDKMADDLIKETEDVVRAAGNDVMASATATAQSISDQLSNELTDNDDKTPTHSLDSLKTSSPEPEIEKALANDSHKSVPSPEPTLAELSAIKTGGPDEQQARRTAPDVHDSTDTNLLSKYSKFFTEIIPPTVPASPTSPNTNNNEFESIIENELAGNVKPDPMATAVKECGTTQWERLADEILATPVTRFVDNPPIESDENANVEEFGKL